MSNEICTTANSADSWVTDLLGPEQYQYKEQCMIDGAETTVYFSPVLSNEGQDWVPRTPLGQALKATSDHLVAKVIELKRTHPVFEQWREMNRRELEQPTE